MKNTVRDLYDIYTENHPKMIGNEVVYIRTWTALEPIREYLLIARGGRVDVYEVRKYTNETMCIKEASFRSVFPALKFLEEYEICRSLEVIKEHPYKKATYVNFDIE